MSEHTPGPWKTIPSRHGSEYLCVALDENENYTTLEILPADARLIAAAPELLAACKSALKWFDDDVHDMDLDPVEHCFILEQVLSDAIKKATVNP